MSNNKNNLEEKTASVLNVRAGNYILYAMDKIGFEQIKSALSGDDYFLHDLAKYPHPVNWSPDSEKNIYVWMHYSHEKDSGASRILKQMSPDQTGEMKFLRAWNTGVDLIMDTKGKYASAYTKK